MGGHDDNYNNEKLQKCGLFIELISHLLIYLDKTDSQFPNTES